MPVYYTERIEGKRAVLDAEESRHCIRVLRLRKGEPVRFVDGHGTLYEALIEDPDPRECTLMIKACTADYLARNYRLHLALAPTKSMERFEWFLEKATEIGVDEITPVICGRSERRSLRMDRCRRILVSAMKQSGRAFLPLINEPADLSDFIRGSYEGHKLIAHCRAGSEKYIGGMEKSNDWLILIGPEGDFSEAEISLASASGFTEISLGDAVLRTETAGVAACQIIAALHHP